MAFRLSTLPAGPVLAATGLGLLAGLGFAFLIPLQERVRLTNMVITPLSYAVNVPLLILSWGMYGVLFYHTLHQLREISAVLGVHSRVNLFDVSPVYGFSGVTGLTAVGLSVVSLGWLVTLPQTASSVAGLLPHVIFIIAAVIAFLWPLLGVHRLLGREKDRLLGANARMIESVGGELHRRVEAGELTGMADVNDTLAGLEVERRLIEGTPTWPWSPGDAARRGRRVAAAAPHLGHPAGAGESAGVKSSPSPSTDTSCDCCPATGPWAATPANSGIDTPCNVMILYVE